MAKALTDEKRKQLLRFAERLKTLMKEKGVSQQEIAKILDVTPQSVSLYATGKAGVDISGLLTLSAFFGVSTDYLLGIEGARRTNEAIQIGEAADFLNIDYDAAYILHNYPKWESPENSARLKNWLSGTIQAYAINIPTSHIWTEEEKKWLKDYIDYNRSRKEADHGSGNA